MINVAFGIAMTVLFWHACTWKGMIFSGIKKVIKPEWYISKPIYGCPICCTPWWGSLIYWLFFSIGGWQMWLLTVGIASGINVISVVFIDLKDAAITYKKKEDGEDS